MVQSQEVIFTLRINRKSAETYQVYLVPIVSLVASLVFVKKKPFTQDI